MSTNHLFLQFFLFPIFMRYPLRITLFGSVETTCGTSTSRSSSSSDEDAFPPRVGEFGGRLSIGDEPMMVVGEVTVDGGLPHSGWFGLIRNGEGGELGTVVGEDSRKGEVGVNKPPPPADEADMDGETDGLEGGPGWDPP